MANHWEELKQEVVGRTVELDGQVRKTEATLLQKIEEAEKSENSTMLKNIVSRLERLENKFDSLNADKGED